MLPYVDLVIADLFIEYVGYKCFEKVISNIKPKYVSTMIQINTDDSFISDSLYLHVFDRLNYVHHQMAEDALSEAMNDIYYKLDMKEEQLLPYGEKLMQLNYKCRQPFVINLISTWPTRSILRTSQFAYNKKTSLTSPLR